MTIVNIHTNKNMTVNGMQIMNTVNIELLQPILFIVERCFVGLVDIERHGCQTYYSCSASACGAKKCTSVKCCGYKCGSSHWHAWGGSSNGCSHQSRTLYY